MIAAATMPAPATDVVLMTPAELKHWRESRGLSQAALAARLELSMHAIRKYEQGQRRVPAFLWRALRDLGHELDGESRVAPPSEPPPNQVDNLP